ncbi:hypothetical protein ACJX0J_031368, partial [Zea mays]
AGSLNLTMQQAQFKMLERVLFCYTSTFLILGVDTQFTLIKIWMTYQPLLKKNTTIMLSVLWLVLTHTSLLKINPLTTNYFFEPILHTYNF